MESLIENIHIILTIISIIITILTWLFHHFYLIHKRNKKLELLLIDDRKIIENAYILFQLYQPQIKVHRLIFNQIKEKNEKAKISSVKIQKENFNQIRIISLDDVLETYDNLMKHLNDISIDNVIFLTQEWIDSYKIFIEKRNNLISTISDN
ncbi:MAG: hypothetical protein ACFFDN_26335 [Candidatus Hodarchaeota archaeon]